MSGTFIIFVSMSTYRDPKQIFPKVEYGAQYEQDKVMIKFDIEADFKVGDLITPDLRYGPTLECTKVEPGFVFHFKVDGPVFSDWLKNGIEYTKIDLNIGEYDPE